MIYNRKEKWLVNLHEREERKASRKHSRQVNHFIFFDTETVQQMDQVMINKKPYNIERNTLQMGWGCYWDRKRDKVEWCFFTTHNQFYEFIERVKRRINSSQLWIMAHNIAFDMTIMKLGEWFKENRYETAFIYNKGMNFISKYVKPKSNISLVNTGNFFAQPLKVMGKLVGLEKMDVDFKRDSFEYIKAYCKRDVEIIFAFIKMWIKFIQDEDLGRLKYTTSGQAFEAYKWRFLNNWIHLHNDEQVLELERNTYYGGRTEAFYLKTVHTPVYYYDVNSMYPYVMLKYKYPTQLKWKRENPSIDYVKKWIDKGYAVCCECTVNTQSDWIPKRSDQGLIFPQGVFKTYLTTPEVQYGIKTGEIIEIKLASFYEQHYIFKDYVEFFYSKRQELKQAGSKLEKLYKNLLTNLYGKYGQKLEGWEQITEEEINKQYYDLLLYDQDESSGDYDKVEFTIDKWIMGDPIFYNSLMVGSEMIEKPKLRYFGNMLQLRTEDRECDTSFCAISSHVTAYGRMLLWERKNWCKEHGTTVYYCDTDSMFTDKIIEAEWIDETILGKMKLEKTYEHGVIFKGLKNYSPLSKDGEIEVKQIDGVDEQGEEITKYIPLSDEVDETAYVVKGEKWHCKGISNKARMINERTFVQQEWAGIGKQEYYQKWGRQPGEYWVLWKEKHNTEDYKKGIKTASGKVDQILLMED